jgi:hypothetical protein
MTTLLYKVSVYSQGGKHKNNPAWKEIFLTYQWTHNDVLLKIWMNVIKQKMYVKIGKLISLVVLKLLD